MMVLKFGGKDLSAAQARRLAKYILRMASGTRCPSSVLAEGHVTSKPSAPTALLGVFLRVASSRSSECASRTSHALPSRLSSGQLSPPVSTLSSQAS